MSYFKEIFHSQSNIKLKWQSKKIDDQASISFYNSGDKSSL